VPLTGTGVLVTLTPGNLDFGSVPVGNTSSGMSVLVTNHKTTALSIASALTSGDFGITSNNCGNSLPAGGSCSIEITFTPKVVGARNGELKFTYMGTGSPQIVGLSGTGM